MRKVITEVVGETTNKVKNSKDLTRGAFLFQLYNYLSVAKVPDSGKEPHHML